MFDKIIRIYYYICIGGGLKKYNKFSTKAIWLTAIVFAAILFAFFGGTYAYFTATAEAKQQQTQTAILRVGFSSDSDFKIQTSELTTRAKVEPGDAVNYTGKIQNVGNVDMYAILEFVIQVDGEEDFLHHEYYLPNGTIITKVGESYNTPAREIKATNSADFALTYTFSGEDYDNAFANKTINIKLVAHAIQTAHIESAVVATNIMLGTN